MAHTESLQYLCRIFFKIHAQTHQGEAKPENCSFLFRQVKVIQSEEGSIFIIPLFCNPRSAYKGKKSHRLQSEKNTVLQCIQDALSSLVSFKPAVSICSIESISFSNHCMQCWVELSSSCKNEELVKFLQSQRNPKVTRNVRGY